MTTAKQKAEVSTAFAAIKDWFAGRCTRRACVERLGVFANAEEIARIMLVADRNKATADHMAWRSLTEADVENAYLAR